MRVSAKLPSRRRISEFFAAWKSAEKKSAAENAAELVKL